MRAKLVLTLQGLVVLVGIGAGVWAATKPGSDVLLLPAIFGVGALIVAWLNELY